MMLLRESRRREFVYPLLEKSGMMEVGDVVDPILELMEVWLVLVIVGDVVIGKYAM